MMRRACGGELVNWVSVKVAQKYDQSVYEALEWRARTGTLVLFRPQQRFGGRHGFQIPLSPRLAQRVEGSKMTRETRSAGRGRRRPERAPGARQQKFA